MIKKFRNWEPAVHETGYVADSCEVIGNAIIGEYSSVWPNAVIRGDIELIKIGNNSNIQDGSLLHCNHGIELHVGNYVTVGHGAILHSCTIGDNSLVGMGAIVLDGAVIGKNCLIGAGAVVTPNTQIPDGSMVLGSPGKVKRELTPEEIEGITKNAQEYVELGKEYKKAVNS